MTTTRDILNDLAQDIIEQQAQGNLHIFEVETAGGFRTEVKEPEIIDELVDTYNDQLKNRRDIACV